MHHLQLRLEILTNICNVTKGNIRKGNVKIIDVTKILVPTLGESVTEAIVAKWLKNQGDKVSSDEPLVELETDKVNVEVLSPQMEH